MIEPIYIQNKKNTKTTKPTTTHTHTHSDGDGGSHAGGDGGGDVPLEEEESRVEESELTMEACLAEFVSYQTVSASEEAFHKEGG